MSENSACSRPMQAPAAPPFSLLVMNGPNLAHVGLRQPELYGNNGLDDIPRLVRVLLGERASEICLSFFQSNHEGALLDRLEQARVDGTHGVVLNAGAYTHTSLALADCIAWIGLPVVEVHISNILARKEAIRHQSLVAAHTVGVIAGFGLMGYSLGVQALHARLCEAQETCFVDNT